MAAIKLSDRIYSVGVLNPNLRVFDIIMRTDYGTSYNAYLVKGERCALIETCHDSYFDEFVDNLQSVVDPADIGYIILNHTEPDHSGALARLLPLCPNAQILCSQSAAMFLKNITNMPDLNAKVVKDGDSVDLGAGQVLSFINAPFLHWPDSMFTYYEAEQTVFTCDFLGAHYCEPRMVDRHITYPEAYLSAMKGYYDAIFGPFPAYVRAGLEKLGKLRFDTVCVSHGPVLTRGDQLPQVLESYAKWSAPAVHPQKQIPIFYVSAYGNTKKLARAIAAGIRKQLPTADVPLYDLVEQDSAQMAAAINSCDAFLLGTPTINRDALAPIWQLVAHLDAINCPKKPCAVFGSYGWSGEGVPAMMQRLSTLKLSVFGEGFRVCFVPTQEDLDKAEAFGAEFAQREEWASSV